MVVLNLWSSSLFGFPPMPQLVIAFLLFPEVTQLDLTGPAQVLSRMGNSRIELVAKSMDPVPTDGGLSLLPTATFKDIRKADILCIPGGIGTTAVMEDEETRAWIREIAIGATWITSVCTGSLVLAAAGLLDGYRATSHWTSRNQLAWFGAIPVAERIVFDRNRVTGAGVTAGIDFALALIGRISGPDQAKLVQLSIEYDPAPPFDSGTPEKADPATLDRFQELAAARLADRAARVEAVAKAMQRGHT